MLPRTYMQITNTGAEADQPAPQNSSGVPSKAGLSSLPAGPDESCNVKCSGCPSGSDLKFRV